MSASLAGIALECACSSDRRSREGARASERPVRDAMSASELLEQAQAAVKERAYERALELYNQASARAHQR